MLVTSCTQAPVVKTGGLTVRSGASFAGKDWLLHLGISPFTGAQRYAVNVERRRTLDVVLVPGATTSDQGRVVRELQAASGVTRVDVLPATPAGGSPVQLRVTVSSADAIDAVLPSLHQDPAVNPIITAYSFFVQSESAAPADVTLDPNDHSAPLHTVSGSVTATSDGHSGTVDILVEYPFTRGRYHLAGRWNCPAATPSIGTAGPNLGTQTATATINDQATRFAPATVTVKVGQIVEWTVPPGIVPYSVTFPNDPDVSSSVLASGATWQIRFTRAGTYHYTDTIHPGNNGVVIVTA